MGIFPQPECLLAVVHSICLRRTGMELQRGGYPQRFNSQSPWF